MFRFSIFGGGGAQGGQGGGVLLCDNTNVDKSQPKLRNAPEMMWARKTFVQAVYVVNHHPNVDIS